MADRTADSPAGEPADNPAAELAAAGIQAVLEEPADNPGKAGAVREHRSGPAGEQHAEQQVLLQP